MRMGGIATMERFFNTAGLCTPDQHYMLPPEERIPDARRFIDARLYFVVHAARQTGKTTAFVQLAKNLTAEGRYTALWTTCEAGQAAGSNAARAEANVLQFLTDEARIQLPEELRPPLDGIHDPEPGGRLASLLQRWSETSPRPVVLFLDEIDALHDESLIAVLHQLRGGYSRRPDHFPQSVALIGLRDVRDYQASYRPDRESLGTASPFNIKVESMTLRNFSADNVTQLYLQHTEHTGQRFSDEALRLGFDLTGGQPWLVNALANDVTWRKVRDRSVTITAEHMEAAKETLIERRDTHLDSLVDKLRDPRVRRVIEPLLAGTGKAFDLLEDDLRYAADLGFITLRPQLAVANPIYQEIIPRALAWTTQVYIAHDTAWYVDAHTGRLDMDRLLAGFVDFWLENAESLLNHQPYPEAAPHLILMAFLQRVLNGGGFIHREYAVGPAAWTCWCAGRPTTAPSSVRPSSSRCGATKRPTPKTRASTSYRDTSTASASTTAAWRSSTGEPTRFRLRSAPASRPWSTRVGGSRCFGGRRSSSQSPAATWPVETR